VAVYISITPFCNVASVVSFCCPPGSWLPALKKQLTSNIRVAQSHLAPGGRHERIERHEIYIQEEDRSSFKKFERKMLQVILNFCDEHAHVFL
jgi:hypothetical protein